LLVLNNKKINQLISLTSWILEQPIFSKKSVARWGPSPLPCYGQVPSGHLEMTLQGNILGLFPNSVYQEVLSGRDTFQILTPTKGFASKTASYTSCPRCSQLEQKRWNLFKAYTRTRNHRRVYLSAN
jgi:hypothetical protein